MRGEKRSEIIHDALNFLDDEMIEEVDVLRGGFVTTKETIEEETVTEMKKKAVRKGTAWRKWATLAASISLFILVGKVWSGMDSIAEDMNMGLQNQESIQEDVNQENIYPDSNLDIEHTDDLADSDEKFQEDSKDFIEESDKSESQNQLMEQKLQNYVAVYYGDKLLTGELHDMMAKFIESYQNGTVSIVDVSDSEWNKLRAEKEKNADGHLYFKLSDGSTTHLVLLGDGTVCDYENQTAWVQMDTRIYNLFVELLKEES